ncbi:MAG: ribosome biogenesis/translation initiation ATPase RLI [Desulfurococcaceae archaeon]
MVRVAVVDKDYCKPKKCSVECIRFCPINRSKKKKAVDLAEDRARAVIYEDICVGCGICVKKCPYSAISIVNLPDEFEKFLIHRYGENMFKLYSLPPPRAGSVLGIIGQNGAGKTTSIKILSGELKPNLGRFADPPDWDEIIRAFRGTEIQAYLTKLANGDIKATVKPQYVEGARRVLRGTVRELLLKADETGLARDVTAALALENILDKKISELSGGELQKFLISAVLLKNANAFFFDEPCSYLDIKERLRAAQAIQEFTRPSKNFVVVVEHDLMILDYVTDYVTAIYGEPGVFGISSKPYGTRLGINNYLKGYLPSENMRIRDGEIKFKLTVKEVEENKGSPILSWEHVIFQYPTTGFKLEVVKGIVHTGEVVGICGPNGIGKTTFIKLVNGELTPHSGRVTISARTVSVKPQEVSPKVFTEDTVSANLKASSPIALDPSSWLYIELVKRLKLNKLLDRRVEELSGGELQKLAVAVTLAREADVYFLDEPSAYLDVEERISVARAIRKIIEEKNKAAIVVEHDLVVQSYVSDKVMVFWGKPAVEGYSTEPLSIRDGLNLLLKYLDITVRKDPDTGRPRINKLGSVLDREQKQAGVYLSIE